MGAWGTGIFSDDVACDIRAEFKELLAAGHSVRETTKRITVEWSEALEDEDDGPVIILALASLQWNHGKLEPKIKARALQIIDSGADLNRWRSQNDARLTAARSAALKRLRAKLTAPQAREKTSPPPKSTKSKSPQTADFFPFPVGQVVAYRLRSKNWILLHTVARKDYSKTENKPTFAILDWQGPSIPDPEAIVDLPYVKPPEFTRAWGDEQARIEETRAYCIEVAARHGRGIPKARLRPLDVCRDAPSGMPQGWIPGVLWRGLDKQLQSDLGLT